MRMWKSQHPPPSTVDGIVKQCDVMKNRMVVPWKIKVELATWSGYLSKGHSIRISEIFAYLFKAFLTVNRGGRNVNIEGWMDMLIKCGMNTEWNIMKSSKAHDNLSQATWLGHYVK